MIRFAGCPSNIFGRDNHFYFLSDNQTDADNAQSICKSSGGSLAEISDNTFRENLTTYFVKRHINSSGLLEIQHGGLNMAVANLV